MGRLNCMYTYTQTHIHHKFIYIERIFYEQRSLAGYRLWDHKESQTWLSMRTHTHTHLWASLVTRYYKICLQCRRHGFSLWVRKIPWRRKWQLTPVFLPGKSHGQRSLVGYKVHGVAKLGHNLAAKQQRYIFIHTMHAYVHLHIPPLSLLIWTDRYGYWDIDRQYMCT